MRYIASVLILLLCSTSVVVSNATPVAVPECKSHEEYLSTRDAFVDALILVKDKCDNKNQLCGSFYSVKKVLVESFPKLPPVPESLNATGRALAICEINEALTSYYKTMLKTLAHFTAKEKSPTPAALTPVKENSPVPVPPKKAENMIRDAKLRVLEQVVRSAMIVDMTKMVVKDLGEKLGLTSSTANTFVEALCMHESVLPPSVKSVVIAYKSHRSRDVNNFCAVLSGNTSELRF